MNKNCIFTTKDPRGYIVDCNRNTWYNHIITGHPIMDDEIESVKASIENPDAIYQSDNANNRDVYFAIVENSSYAPLYTKTVVEYNKSNLTGKVVSSWPQEHISGGIKEGGLKYVKPKL